MKEKELFSAITENIIKQLTSEKVFQRGHDYYENGAVCDIYCIGKVVEAHVEGSEYTPYKVKVKLDKGGIKETPLCSCPFGNEFSGICKHTVATLLTILYAPEKIVFKEKISDLLAKLKREDLEKFVMNLVDNDMSLHEELEEFIESYKNIKKKKSTRKSKIDLRKYKDQVVSLVHNLDRMSSSQAYWHVGEVVGDIQRLITKARPFLEASDGESAIQILKGIAEGYILEWTCLDGSNGDTPNPFYDLDESFAEAILVTDISGDIKESLKLNIEEWISEIENYGVDDAFSVTLLAMEEGWTDKNVIKRLEGKIIKKKKADDKKKSQYDYYTPRDTEQILDKIRLNILQRQERFDEYMNFALAKGHITEFLKMKIASGKLEESISLAKKHISSGQESYEIVKQLRQEGFLNEALEIGDIGLSFSDYNSTLGDYLADLAAGMKNNKLAIKAIQKAFYDHPSLKRFNRTMELAPKTKVKEIKSEYLKMLKSSKQYFDSSEKVKIFLQENLYDDAMKESQSFGYYNETLLVEVMEKVLTHNPSWVTKESKKRAMSIIDGGKSKYYHSAVDWLKWTSKGYLQQKKENGWERCLSTIRINHKPKRKLMGLLNDVF